MNNKKEKLIRVKNEVLRVIMKIIFLSFESEFWI